MTSEEVKTTVKKHRKSAIQGGILGVLLVGGYFIFQVVMTPTEPDIQAAPVGDVIAYVINPRGLDKLTDIEQERLLERWKDRIAKDVAYKDALKTGLESLSDTDRKAFTDVLFKHLKRAFVEDAATFSQLSTVADKSEFCRRNIAELDAQSTFLKEIAVVFKSDFPGPDKFQEWIISHTSAAERQLGEPYIDALKRVRIQVKKEDRAQTSARN